VGRNTPRAKAGRLLPHAQSWASEALLACLIDERGSIRNIFALSCAPSVGAGATTTKGRGLWVLSCWPMRHFAIGPPVSRSQMSGAGCATREATTGRF